MRKIARPSQPNRPERLPVRVRGNEPALVAGEQVESIIDDWLIETGWWTSRAINRRYWEVVTRRGRRLVIFHDLDSGVWFTHKV